MNIIKFNLGQEDQDGVLRQVAIWHNTTPKLWLKDYKMSEEDIVDTMTRLSTTAPEDLFLQLAYHKNQVIGFIWANRLKDKPTEAMIMSLYVLEEYRQQAIGTQLKDALEAECKSCNVTKLHTTVHSKNKKMLALNQKLGYKSGMVSMTKEL